MIEVDFPAFFLGGGGMKEYAYVHFSLFTQQKGLTFIHFLPQVNLYLFYVAE